MNNINGILLMIAAMAGFAMEDLFVKLLSSTISTGQILMTLGLCGASVFALLAHSKGHSIFALRIWTRAVIARSFMEASSAIAFVTALSLVPLSTVATIFQATPLVITMGAALFLGEQVGWRRWSAIFIGLIGVLIIIRPGFSGFDVSVLFVLIAVLGVAARDLITRGLPKNMATTIIACQAFASLFIVGVILVVMSSDSLVAVSLREASYFLGATIFGVAGYYGIVLATREGDAAIVTPFRYTRLLFSIVIGMVVFHERPDAFTLLGAVIIIGTGLFTFYRERRLAAALHSA